MNGARAWLGALFAGLGFVAACGGGSRSHVQEYQRSPDAPNRFTSATLRSLQRARDALDAGDARAARAELAALAPEAAADFSVRLMRQDCELALAGDDTSELERAARELAEREPSAANLLLWARIDPDSAASRATIEHALALAPRNPWAHYAAAHDRARSDDWPAAADAIERALELDPGHRAARRLEAAILARGANAGRAAAALDAWLAATRDDPRVSSRVRASAQLDLAHLRILREQPARALEILREVDAREAHELARWCLIAAAEQDMGRSAEAADAARHAASLDPDALAPLVQIALLRSHSLSDPEGARAAWQAVLDATRGATDLGSLIQGLRARVELERDAGGAP